MVFRSRHFVFSQFREHQRIGVVCGDVQQMERQHIVRPIDEVGYRGTRIHVFIDGHLRGRVRRRRRRVPCRRRRRVAARDFHTVHISHKSVVVFHVQRQRLKLRHICYRKRNSRISRRINPRHCRLDVRADARLHATVGRTNRDRTHRQPAISRVANQSETRIPSTKAPLLRPSLARRAAATFINHHANLVVPRRRECMSAERIRRTAPAVEVTHCNPSRRTDSAHLKLKTIIAIHTESPCPSRRNRHDPRRLHHIVICIGIRPRRIALRRVAPGGA